MAQLATRIEAQTEKTSSADKFYVVGGGAIRDGSVTCWKYDLGTPLTSKVKIQGLDDERKTMTFAVLEGDILKLYSSFKATLHAVKAGNGGCMVKWTMVFEKANVNAPDPGLYMDLATKLSKGVDAY
uniref:kirola-like n=1 Tax=Fragaria vesca subsp. vesca TaxID=101020 RepID=UPI0005C93C2D|nr:PREDICTED: kirola-like [Fragaria vesca subsp. vesca]